MAAWIFLLTNPFDVGVYYGVFEMLYAIRARLGAAMLDIPLGQRILFFCAFIFISCAVHYNLLFTNEAIPSMVDVTPIANLKTGQIVQMENAIARFDDYENTSKFAVNNTNLYSYGRIKNYEFSIRKEEEQRLLRIDVDIFEDEGRAIERFEHILSGLQDRKHIYIQNDNGTEAILFHSFRDGNAFHTGPITRRYLRTDLLAGNAIITMSENIERDQLHLSLTSDFIELLCELLEMEEQ